MIHGQSHHFNKKKKFSPRTKEACDEQNRTRILGSSYLAFGATFVEMVSCCFRDKEQQKLGTPKMEARKESERCASMKTENFLQKVRILIGAGRYTWKRSP